MSARRLRVAVVGHAQYVTLAAAPALPGPGAILHLAHPTYVAGGGGAITFFQLVRSPAEVHFFTALGTDGAGVEVEGALRASRATIHVAHRARAHPRDLVLVTPDGERTIVVMQPPLHPKIGDALPWGIFADCDAVFFTGDDAAVLRTARAARLLVATARRAAIIAAAGVEVDVVVGSLNDPRESTNDYPLPPRALVLTDGPRGGRIVTASGSEPFAAPPAPPRIVGSYGAGDSFAGALTWHLVAGLSLKEACERAGPYGAAVLAGTNPLEHQRPLA
ncbi:MAG: sugar kinase [Deltaproteobacteria bacterium]|nr:sugar kinase [Deltaproteobacteria bacterium]